MIIIKRMNMMLLPLPVTHIIAKNERNGLMYSRESDFRIGKPQPIFVTSGLGMVFVWTGQITKSGEYLYKHFKKISSLTIKSI